MTTPAEHIRTAHHVQTDPWVERSVDAVADGRRLHAEQPESGLLWVLAGSVTVHKGGRSREVRPGAVVSYRLGDELSWSAGEGSRVRWSEREVRLDAGEVASWTANLALEVSATDAEAAPRRRQGVYATAAIAATWIIALTVAWCYHQAQSAQETGAKGTSTTRKTLSPEQQARIGVVKPLFEAFLLRTGEGERVARYAVKDVVFGGKDVTFPYVHLELAREDAIPDSPLVELFRAPADEVLARWPDMKGVLVVLAVKSGTFAQVAYGRGTAEVVDSRSGGGR